MLPVQRQRQQENQSLRNGAAHDTGRAYQPVADSGGCSLGIIAVGIFLFISNFGFGGFLGGVLSDVGFGIFGWMAYLFPILLVFFHGISYVKPGSTIAGVKFVSHQ